MFAGLSRAEHNVIICLLFFLLCMAVVVQTRERLVVAADDMVHGSVVHHPPGVLSVVEMDRSDETGEAEYLRDGRVDLNRAPAEVLANALPGVGPARSQAIVSYRERHGWFEDVADLENVPGIGPRSMETLGPLLYVDGVPGVSEDLDPFADRWMAEAEPAARAAVGIQDLPRPVNINTASAEELEQLPGIGPAISERIVEDRRLRGPFRTVHDLQRVSGIGPRTLENLRPLITVSNPPIR